MRTRYGWIACALCFVTAVAFADVKSGIIALWTFESGDASDQVGNNNGILHGGVEFVEGHNGGLAASFNGTDGYIEVPHSPDFDVMANGYTVAAWVFVRDGRDHSAIAFKGTKIGWGPNFLFRIATTSNTGLTWGACNATTEGWFATNNAYNAGEWVHLAPDRGRLSGDRLR
ncbi:MAG: hypothetical protein KatS3mg115_1536 [Candidatus Poribacteria bacterium]|nr:MAG: hypothetical protein KatS3mg115_1536 [Candidatus Poribacteria bacterium]